MRIAPVTRFLLTGLSLMGTVGLAMYLLFLRADGRSDAYYLRFASPRQQSLVIGSSRAAQGIQPAVLNAELGRNDLYNFSFTVGTTPYGADYTDLIERKLARPDEAPDIFILSVDPWSLSVTCASGPDSLCLEEHELFTGQLTEVAQRPNLEYLLNHYDKSFYRIVLPETRAMEVQDDGWLKVDFPMNEEKLAANRAEKIAAYQAYADLWRMSDYRVRELLRLIDRLQERGQVYLVRLPIDPLMFAVEEEYAPAFSDSLRRWTATTGVPLLDLTPDNGAYETLDGHHLEQASGRRASRAIAEFIRNNQ